jgi:hypothetical protein
VRYNKKILRGKFLEINAYSKKKQRLPGMVVYSCNPSPWDAEVKLGFLVRLSTKGI